MKQEEIIVFYADLMKIAKEECSVLHARQLAAVDKGRISSRYELDDMLEELQLSASRLRALLQHTAKTYIVKPQYHSLGLKWVLSNMQRVLLTEEIKPVAVSSQTSGIYTRAYTDEELNAMIDDIESIEI